MNNPHMSCSQNCGPFWLLRQLMFRGTKETLGNCRITLNLSGIAADCMEVRIVSSRE